jgi:3-hydroxymyristoyl/3-hydroxydecanoyl-(acyl carrier protein) dehydratase
MIKVDIESLLPQKVPFVMVNTLLAYTAERIQAAYVIKPTDIFIENHHFNEAGIIEHMAQTVALHTGYQYFLKNEKAPVGYIGSISEVKIDRLPEVGDELITEVEILQEFMGITLVSASTTVNGELVGTGKMKTVLAK